MLRLFCARQKRWMSSSRAIPTATPAAAGRGGSAAAVGAPKQPPSPPQGIIDANGNLLRSSKPVPPPAARPPPGAAPRGTPLEKDIVVEVDESNFQALVLTSPVPVILNAYADWSEPGKALTEKLEAVVRAARGAIRLAKLNVDVSQQLASQLKIRSVPTVFGIVGGRAVTSFEGVPADENLRSFFDTLLAAGERTGATPTPVSRAADAVAVAHQMVDDGQIDEALESLPPIIDVLKELRSQGVKQLNNVVAGADKAAAQMATTMLAAAKTSGPLFELDSLHARALAAMVRALAAASTDATLSQEKAADTMQQLQAVATVLRSSFSHCKSAEVARALAAADVATAGGPLRAELAPLIAACEAAPNDLDARFSLAEAQLGVGQHAAAIESCLAVLKSGGPGWREGAARTLLLKVFDTLGQGNPLSLSGRKQLSKLLFR